MEDKVYELPLRADEVRSLVSAISMKNPLENEENAAAFNGLRRKATALMTYVDADRHCEEAEELYREALEQDKNLYHESAW